MDYFKRSRPWSSKTCSEDDKHHCLDQANKRIACRSDRSVRSDGSDRSGRSARSVKAAIIFEARYIVLHCGRHWECRQFVRTTWNHISHFIICGNVLPHISQIWQICQICGGSVVGHAKTPGDLHFYFWAGGCGFPFEIHPGMRSLVKFIPESVTQWHHVKLPVAIGGVGWQGGLGGWVRGRSRPLGSRAQIVSALWFPSHTDYASSSWIRAWGGQGRAGLNWFHFRFTLSHLDSFGLTWFHLDSSGFTWLHLDSLGLTWIHLDSPGLTVSHLVSYGLNCTHFD